MAWNCGLAESPSSYDHAWTIVTPHTTPNYTIKIAEEVAVSTKHKWADVAVLDAVGQRMYALLIWPEVPPSALVDTQGVKYVRQDTPELIYRCETYAPVIGSIGLRLDYVDDRPTHDPIAVTVRNESREAIGSFHGVPGLDEGVAHVMLVPFTHAANLNIFNVEFSSPGFRIFRAQLVSRPLSSSRKAPLFWYRAGLEQNGGDGKQFVYSLSGGTQAVAGRFSFSEPITAATALAFSACRRRDCSDADRQYTQYADILNLGSESPSYPVRITDNNNSYDRGALFLRVTSSQALTAPPRLEVGGPLPKLEFMAKGVPPYALVAGRTSSSSDKTYTPMPQNNMPFYGVVTSQATLSPYSAPSRFLGLFVEYAALALFLFALALSLFWATRPIRDVDG